MIRTSFGSSRPCEDREVISERRFMTYVWTAVTALRGGTTPNQSSSIRLDMVTT
ncbi:hypothetical protein [Streptomyces sp. NBC_00212]|uniref:hypothetical protein n=1 Tax=Streptomyces sp. NBC_00212 TaxID=2975684 RepID=UPI00324B22D7